MPCGCVEPLRTLFSQTRTPLARLLAKARKAVWDASIGSPLMLRTQMAARTVEVGFLRWLSGSSGGAVLLCAHPRAGLAESVSIGEPRGVGLVERMPAQAMREAAPLRGSTLSSSEPVLALRCDPEVVEFVAPAMRTEPFGHDAEAECRRFVVAGVVERHPIWDRPAHLRPNVAVDDPDPSFDLHSSISESVHVALPEQTALGRPLAVGEDFVERPGLVASSHREGA